MEGVVVTRGVLPWRGEECWVVWLTEAGFRGDVLRIR